MAWVEVGGREIREAGGPAGECEDADKGRQDGDRFRDLRAARTFQYYGSQVPLRRGLLQSGD